MVVSEDTGPWRTLNQRFLGGARYGFIVVVIIVPILMYLVWGDDLTVGQFVGIFAVLVIATVIIIALMWAVFQVLMPDPLKRFDIPFADAVVRVDGALERSGLTYYRMYLEEYKHRGRRPDIRRKAEVGFIPKKVVFYEFNGGVALVYVFEPEFGAGKVCSFNATPYKGEAKALLDRVMTVINDVLAS